MGRVQQPRFRSSRVSAIACIQRRRQHHHHQRRRARTANDKSRHQQKRRFGRQEGSIHLPRFPLRRSTHHLHKSPTNQRAHRSIPSTVRIQPTLFPSSRTRPTPQNNAHMPPNLLRNSPNSKRQEYLPSLDLGSKRPLEPTRPMQTLHVPRGEFPLR